MSPNAEHLEKWIENAQAELVDKEVSSRFTKYLNSLNWSVSGLKLDFNEFPHKKINLSQIEESTLVSEIKNSSIGQSEKLFFFYNDTKPCLACELEFGLKNIDQAYWKAPGPRYMFCGNIIEGEVQEDFERLLMIDGVETLYYRI